MLTLLPIHYTKQEFMYKCGGGKILFKKIELFLDQAVVKGCALDAINKTKAAS